MHFIYKLYFASTGKSYVGHTKNINRRMAAHRSKKVLPMNDGMTLEILETVDDGKAEAMKAEQRHILAENTVWPHGHNWMGGGGVNCHHDGTKKLIAESARGNKKWLGRQHTPETKKLMSEQRKELAAKGSWGGSKGRIWTPEMRAKMAAAVAGRPCPYKGQKRDPEIGKKVSAALTGRKSKARKRTFTDEERKALSDKVRGFKHSEEAKAKMRAAHAARAKAKTLPSS